MGEKLFDLGEDGSMVPNNSSTEGKGTADEFDDGSELSDDTGHKSTGAIGPMYPDNYDSLPASIDKLEGSVGASMTGNSLPSYGLSNAKVSREVNCSGKLADRVLIELSLRGKKYSDLLGVEILQQLSGYFRVLLIIPFISLILCELLKVGNLIGPGWGSMMWIIALGIVTYVSGMIYSSLMTRETIRTLSFIVFAVAGFGMSCAIILVEPVIYASIFSGFQGMGTAQSSMNIPISRLLDSIGDVTISLIPFVWVMWIVAAIYWNRKWNGLNEDEFVERLMTSRTVTITV